MIEALFVLGFGMMVLAVAGAVIVALFQVVAWLLWIPIKLLGWVAGAVFTAIGALFCLILLPFTLIAGLIGGVFSALTSPAIMLLIIGMLAFALHQQNNRVQHTRTRIHMRNS